MSANKSEIEFLESYYKFFLEKGNSLEEFRNTVIRTLITSGDITMESLDYFFSKHELEIAIKLKEMEISKEQAEYEVLKSKLVKLKKENGFIKPKATSDGCGSSMRRSSPC
jgi:stalled ribosome rescue protein Dom34